MLWPCIVLFISNESISNWFLAYCVKEKYVLGLGLGLIVPPGAQLKADLVLKSSI